MSSKNGMQPGGLWPVDSVIDAAQGCGIEALTPEVAGALASDVEYRIHEVIEESIRFMRHAKRTTLKPQDVDFALKAKNIDPLWGFSLPLISEQGPVYLKTYTAQGTIYVPDDEEIDLTKLLSLPLPPVPRPVSYTAHWLAVEGVQPAIPQNPSRSEIEAYTQTLNTAKRSSLAASSTQLNKDGHEVNVRPLVKHVLSRELQLYFDRLTAALLSSELSATHSNASNPNDVQDADNMRSAALSSLRQDQGLSGLIPYLIQWSAEKVSTYVTLSTTDTEEEKILVCETALGVLEAMLMNNTLFIEPYLHQLMPIMLTCLLNASAPYQTRLTASQLLSYVLNKYSHSYPSLKVRILKTFLRALIDPLKSISTRLGAVLGLRELGKNVIRQVLAVETNLKALGRVLDQTLAQEDSDVSPSDVDLAKECAANVVDSLIAVFPPSTSVDIDVSMRSESDVEEYGRVLGEQLAKHMYLVEAIRSAEEKEQTERKRSAAIMMEE